MATKRLSAEQKTFNKVYRHAMKQNEKCMDANHNCVYRGPRKLRCFAGALIPDSKYTKEMEYTNANQPLVGFVLEEGGYCPSTAQRLQRIHDHKPVQNWKEELESFARRNNLTIPT